MRACLAVLLLAACGDGAIAPDACLLCEPRSTCEGGVAKMWRGDAPGCLPAGTACSLPQVQACRDGCEREGLDLGAYLDVEYLCAVPSKVVGDPCPCAPTRATDAAPYLRCDFDADVCVEAEAPVVEGWLEPCSRDDELCLVDGACTGRTIACVGDWECPAGASCDLIDVSSGQPLCRPGPRGAPIDLGC